MSNALNKEEDIVLERGYHLSVIKDNKLYIFGGVTHVYDKNEDQMEFPKHKKYANCQQIYDLTTENWSKIDPSGNYPSSFENSACVVIGDSILVFGGWDGKQHMNKTYEFKFSSSHWSELQCEGMLPTPRAGHTMNLLGNYKIFVFAGQGNRAVPGTTNYPLEICDFKQSDKYANDFFNNQSFLLDPRAKNWNLLRTVNTPEPRAYHSCCVLNDTVYMFGGRNATTSTLSDFWHLNIKHLEWKRICTKMCVPSFYRHTMNIIWDRYLLVCGGWENTGKLSESLWLYDIKMDSWKKIKTINFQPRAGHTANHVSQKESGEILIYGGEIDNMYLRCLVGNVEILNMMCLFPEYKK